MNHDPLWNEIRRALEDSRFAPTLFERCAQDLLRQDYPQLAPVVGGSDGGMDGSSASCAGPFPLVCTTGEDVIGNFRNSISNHLRIRGGPKRCIVATSEFLTPQRRQNILNEAKTLGVSVDNIHDGEDFIGRLYVDHAWRFELLGVTGSPPALSILPPRVRRFVSPLIVGREKDLGWLKGATADLLIVGQPGSGKTFLHQHLQGAMFAVSDDPTQLANAIRALAPEAIVVDDAHIRLAQIDLLRRLRAQLGASFRIHANCWPHAEKVVASRLEIKTDQIRRLKPVARKVMAELIESLGIGGPDVVIQLLLDQSMGKPGLCVALVDACKRDEVQKIWTGEVIAEHLLFGGSSLRDDTDREILARFALGGSRGSSSTEVARGVGTTLAELRSRVAELGAGGIVVETGENSIAVVPDALRGVLVRDVFFNGAVRPDIDNALRDCVNQLDGTHVLIAAAQRGAFVPRSLIRSRIVDCDSDTLWKHYAFLDEASAREIIDEYPDKVGIAAKGLLESVPHLALPALIRNEATKAGPTRRQDGTTHAVVSGWLSPWDRLNLSVDRRRALVACLKALRASQNRLSDDVVLEYAALAIDPSISDTRSSPIDRNTIMMRRGLHPRSTLECIHDLWPDVLALLPMENDKGWSRFFDTISDWAWPGRRSENSDTELANYMRTVATRILTDILAKSQNSPLRRNRIRWISEYAGLGLEVPEDDFFDRIFDDRDRTETWEQQQEKRRVLFNELTTSLVDRGIDAACKALGGLESNVRGESPQGGWDRDWLYLMIAQRVDRPNDWIEPLLARQIPPQYVSHFLEETKKRLPHEFENAAERLLADEVTREVATRLILSHLDLPNPLVVRAIDSLMPLEKDNEFRFSYRQLSVAVMLRLLKHSHPEIRYGAAIGEWQYGKNFEIREEIIDAWQYAIIHAEPKRDHVIGELFKAHPSVGFAWASRMIREAKYDLWRHDGIISVFASAMSVEQRRDLLLLMDDSERFDDGWFHSLLGDQYDLFAQWLDNTNDNQLRISPLSLQPSERWERLTAIALDRGVTPEQVADLIGHWDRSWSGSEREHFQAYVTQYETMRQHPDPRFHVIARRGLEWAKSRVERALTREELDEV